MNFNPLTSYELIGIIITALTAVITYLKSRDDVKAQNVALASVIGVALTLVLGMRFDAIPKLQAQLTEADILRRNPARRALLERAVGSGHLTLPGNSLVAFTLKQRMDSLRQQFHDISSGRFSVSEVEMPIVIIQMIQSAKKNIEATNYVGTSLWWKQAWGEQYEEANEALAKRGVDVTRVFIFDGADDMKAANPIMLREAQNGIHVRYANLSDLPPFTGDVVVVDGVLEGQEQIVPGKGISEAIFSVDASDVNQAKYAFQNIEANSREFRP